MLIGNKSDLEHRRAVTYAGAHRRRLRGRRNGECRAEAHRWTDRESVGGGGAGSVTEKQRECAGRMMRAAPVATVAFEPGLLLPIRT